MREAKCIFLSISSSRWHPRCQFNLIGGCVNAASMLRQCCVNASMYIDASFSVLTQCCVNTEKLVSIRIVALTNHWRSIDAALPQPQVTTFASMSKLQPWRTYSEWYFWRNWRTVSLTLKRAHHKWMSLFNKNWGTMNWKKRSQTWDQEKVMVVLPPSPSYVGLSFFERRMASRGFESRKRCAFEFALSTRVACYVDPTVGCDNNHVYMNSGSPMTC